VFQRNIPAWRQARYVPPKHHNKYCLCDGLVIYKMFNSSGSEAHSKWTLPATNAKILHITSQSKKIPQKEKSYLEKDQTADVS